MMARLATEPENCRKSRRVVAERETLLEFTVRVVAEPETLAEITTGWSQMVTKPKKRPHTKTPFSWRGDKTCSLSPPGTHNKGARLNAVTIPMGGRRA